MKTSDSERHLAVPSMKRLGSLRKRPFFHSKLIKLCRFFFSTQFHEKLVKRDRRCHNFFKAIFVKTSFSQVDEKL